MTEANSFSSSADVPTATPPPSLSQSSPTDLNDYHENGNESNDEEDDERHSEQRYQDQDDLGLSEMESLCMNCMENGKTRMMVHKIPYFRELIIASFACPHCGERNNEVTFGGEIQIQVCSTSSHWHSYLPL
jgi:hypothetical protein